jgi:hypothetical protein
VLAVWRHVALAFGLLLLLACWGCGGSTRSSSGGPNPSPSTAKGASSEAPTVRVADCRLWRVLPTDGRNRLIVAMRQFFGGTVDAPHLRGQVLPDGQAKRLFDSYCSRTFASAFKLYKIYGRAAAFTPASS